MEERIAGQQEWDDFINLFKNMLMDKNPEYYQLQKAWANFIAQAPATVSNVQAFQHWVDQFASKNNLAGVYLKNPEACLELCEMIADEGSNSYAYLNLMFQRATSGPLVNRIEKLNQHIATVQSGYDSLTQKLLTAEDMELYKNLLENDVAKFRRFLAKTPLTEEMVSVLNHSPDVVNLLRGRTLFEIIESKNSVIGSKNEGAYDLDAAIAKSTEADLERLLNELAEHEEMPANPFADIDDVNPMEMMLHDLGVEDIQALDAQKIYQYLNDNKGELSSAELKALLNPEVVDKFNENDETKRLLDDLMPHSSEADEADENLDPLAKLLQATKVNDLEELSAKKILKYFKSHKDELTQNEIAGLLSDDRLLDKFEGNDDEAKRLVKVLPQALDALDGAGILDKEAVLEEFAKESRASRESRNAISDNGGELFNDVQNKEAREMLKQNYQRLKEIAGSAEAMPTNAVIAQFVKQLMDPSVDFKSFGQAIDKEKNEGLMILFSMRKEAFDAAKVQPAVKHESKAERQSNELPRMSKGKGDMS